MLTAKTLFQRESNLMYIYLDLSKRAPKMLRLTTLPRRLFQGDLANLARIQFFFVQKLSLKSVILKHKDALFFFSPSLSPSFRPSFLSFA